MTDTPHERRQAFFFPTCRLCPRDHRGIAQQQFRGCRTGYLSPFRPQHCPTEVTIGVMCTAYAAPPLSPSGSHRLPSTKKNIPSGKPSHFAPCGPRVRQTFANANFKYYLISDFSYSMALSISSSGLLYFVPVLLSTSARIRRRGPHGHDGFRLRCFVLSAHRLAGGSLGKEAGVYCFIRPVSACCSSAFII